MKFSDKILAGRNIKNVSGLLKNLQMDRCDESVSLIFIRYNSNNIMEILTFNEYQKQIRKSDFVLFSISFDKEEAFLIVENLFGGYFSKNERYNTESFLSFINFTTGSSLYEITSVDC